MFGNRLGWGISAVLSAVVLSLVWKLASLNAMSPPSQGLVSRTGNVALNLAASPQKLDPLTLPFSAGSILPTMTEQADPAPIYRKAIADYKANPDAYSNPRGLKGPRGFDALIRAKNCRPSTIFAANAAEVIGYMVGSNDPLADVEALYAVGKAAARAALGATKEQPAEALSLAEGVFSLGVKLYEERLRFREFDAGAELLRDGAYLIGQLDPSRASAADAVAPAMKQLVVERAMPLWVVISSIDPNVVGRTAGDIFYIARNSKERMWQIEATLKLGRQRHDQGEGGRGADGRWAAITVKKMANDPSLDPAVRIAAKRAAELTVEQHRMLGG